MERKREEGGRWGEEVGGREKKVEDGGKQGKEVEMVSCFVGQLNNVKLEQVSCSSLSRV